MEKSISKKALVSAKHFNSKKAAGKAAKLFLASVMMAAPALASEITIRKDGSFSTPQGIVITADSVLAKDSAGKYGVILSVNDTGAVTLVQGAPATRINDIDVALTNVIPGVRDTWITLDTTVTQAVVPDSTFTLQVSQDASSSKDTLGAKITMLDVSESTSGGNRSTILKVSTAKGTPIVELLPGGKATVQTSDSTAIEITEISSSTSALSSSATFTVREISTEKTLTKGQAYAAGNGYSVTLKEMITRIDDQGKNDYIVVSVKGPDGKTADYDLSIGNRQTIMDSTTGKGVAITANSAQTSGTALSGSFFIEPISNELSFEMGKPVMLGEIPVELHNVTDTSAIFGVGSGYAIGSGSLIELSKGESDSATIAGKTVTICLSNFVIGKYSAYANAEVRIEGEFASAARHADINVPTPNAYMVPLSQNRFSIVFGKGGRHTIDVLDAAGRRARSATVNGSRCTLDLSGLGSGQYFVTSDGAVLVKARIARQ